MLAGSTSLHIKSGTNLIQRLSRTTTSRSDPYVSVAESDNCNTTKTEVIATLIILTFNAYTSRPVSIHPLAYSPQLSASIQLLSPLDPPQFKQEASRHNVRDPGK